jgi:hypothetical protein
MKYRGAPKKGPYVGATSSGTKKYRGAPAGGATGYYKGRPTVTTSSATTTPRGSTARPVMTGRPVMSRPGAGVSIRRPTGRTFLK